MTGRLFEPKNARFTEAYRDFGFQAGVGMEFKAGNYLYRNAYSYDCKQDKRDPELDDICKQKLLKHFWRRLGAM